MYVLAEITPLNPSDGSRPVIRVCNANDPDLTGHGGERWIPAVMRAPKLRIDLFDGEFAGDVDVGSGQMELRIDVLRRFDVNVPAWVWPGAGIVVSTWVAGAATEVFRGKVARFQGREETIDVIFDVDYEPFNVDVLAAAYAGSGGIEGGADIKGRPKPWLFGACQNVEPVLIDAVNNVWQVSAYGPVSGIPKLYERGSEFAPSTGDHANYAALVAASIPEGDWATCLASGLIRLGAPNFGLITADVDGDNSGATYRRLTGGILAYIASGLGIDSGLIDSASIAGLDTDVPYNVNIYITEQVKFLDLARRMALPCNAIAGVDLLGNFFVSRVALGTASMTLDAQGRQLPRVLEATESTVQPPYKRIMLGANRCWRVHAPDEIATVEVAAETFVEAFVRSPTQPATPTGGGIPSGWSAVPPGYVSEPFGPVWRTTSTQAGGTIVTGWTAPVLSDSLYQNWALDLADTQTKLKAATTAIRADSDYVHGTDTPAMHYIDKPIIGPCKLSCTVKGSADQVAFGFMHFDPGGGLVDAGDINTGFLVLQGDSLFFMDALTDIFPFTNYDIDGGYINDSYNGLAATIVADTVYDLVYNGETVECFVAGERVRTYYVNPSWDDLPRWPVFQLLSADAEITDILWERGTHGRTLEFIYDQQFGGMRRMDFENGWEMNTPLVTEGFAAGGIYSRPFSGGGMLQARIGGVSSTSGTTAFSILQMGDKGTIVFDEDGTFESWHSGGGGAAHDTGTWSAGDTFTLEWRKKRIRIYKNGVKFDKKKVGASGTVQAYIEFGANGSFYDIQLIAMSEEEFTNKSVVNDTTLTSPITDGSPTVTGSFILIAETPEMAVSPGDDTDEIRVSASVNYTYTAGGAATFLPATKIQRQVDGGAWSDVTTAQTPASAPAATAGGASQDISLVGTFDVSATGRYRFRLLMHNTDTGTYSVDLAGHLLAEWQG